MTKWHYHKDGVTRGPYDDEQLKALVEAGTVTGTTLVWKKDLAGWTPLAETGFSRGAAPPSPPRAPVVQPAHAPSPARPSQPSAAAAPPVASPAAPPAGTSVVGGDNLSMWRFFTRALTSKFATFSGRARRKEYWSYGLFYFIFLVLAFVAGTAIDVAAGNLGNPDRPEQPIAMFVLAGLWMIVNLIPNIAVLVRRLHDVGMSGWLALIYLIPYLGWLVIFVFSLLPSHPGTNKYGPSPLPAPPAG